ncbi:MAG: hypothetical protein V1774_11830 [Candidatus Eisenbacteria bacterium]
MRSCPLVVLGCFLLIIFGLGVLPGCNDEDQPRSRVRIVRIADPEDSEDISAAVFQSDVRDAGADGEPFTEDDVIFEDELLITVENQPVSPLLTLEPDGPFGAVVLTGYRVDFAVDEESLDPVSGSLHLVIPTGEERDAAIVAVSAALKAVPPLSTLAQTGGEIAGSATITFWGYEETSEDEVTAAGSFQIHFADWME